MLNNVCEKPTTKRAHANNNMKKIKKIEKSQIDKIKKLIKKAPLYVAKHVIQVSIGLLLIALIIGGVYFYKCNILSTKEALKSIDNSCPLNERAYNKVLKAWEENDLRFEMADINYYENITSF